MKSDAIQSIKFLRLKRRLRLTTWQAVGVLESLWILTQKNAPAGDIGKFSNDDIAAGVEWLDDADALVEALVDTRWLDKSDQHRLVVHDWHDHCPNHIRGGMAKSGRDFASKEEARVQASDEARVLPKLPPRIPPKVEAKDIAYRSLENEGAHSKNEAKVPYSNLTEPNPTNSNQTNSKLHTHTQSEDEINLAIADKIERTLEQAGQLPHAIAGDDGPELLRTWLKVRHATHGSIVQPESLRAMFSRNNHWSEKRWRDSLEMSIAKASKDICDAENDFQKRSGAKATQTPKQRVRLPENEDAELARAIQ